MKLSIKDRNRLIALLGLLGVENPHERANAASLVERFRREHGFTWKELLTDQPKASSPPADPDPEPYAFLRGVIVVLIISAGIATLLVYGTSMPSMSVTALAIIIYAAGRPVLSWWHKRSMLFKKITCYVMAFALGGAAAIAGLAYIIVLPD